MQYVTQMETFDPCNESQGKKDLKDVMVGRMQRSYLKKNSFVAMKESLRKCNVLQRKKL
jgi:hypothetical protein